MVLRFCHVLPFGVGVILGVALGCFSRVLCQNSLKAQRAMTPEATPQIQIHNFCDDNLLVFGRFEGRRFAY